MHNSVARWLIPFLFVAVVFSGGSAFPAEPIDVPDTLFVRGLSRLKAKKFPTAKGSSHGRLDFNAVGRCGIQLEGLLTLIGDCEFSQNNKIIMMVPDPDSIDNAIASFLDVSIFKFPLRGFEPGRVSLKIKLKQKAGEITGKVRFKMNFIAQLVVPGDPAAPEVEVVEPFQMKYRFKSKVSLSE